VDQDRQNHDDNLEFESRTESEEYADVEYSRPEAIFSTKTIKTINPSFVTKVIGMDEIKTCLVYDTGAEAHICNDLSLFVWYKPQISAVSTGNDTTECVGYGDAIFYPTAPLCKEAKQGILLKNARYSPGFHSNLFSASIGRKSGIKYDDENQSLYKGDKKIYQIRIDGVYYMTWSVNMAKAWSTRISQLKPILKSTDKF
jgi:hypothetical protein